MDAEPGRTVLGSGGTGYVALKGGLRSPAFEVRLESPHAERQYRSAPSVIRDALRRRAGSLAADPHTGTLVSLRKVPKDTRRKWERRVGPVGNLYKLDLPDGWRVLYTAGTEGQARVILILEVVDHKEYDRLLGYG